MSNLNEVLTLPSIRAELDKWLKSQPWSGNQGFKNLTGLYQLEKAVLDLQWNHNLELNEAIQIVLDSAEGIINEIYSFSPSQRWTKRHIQLLLSENDDKTIR